MATPEVVHLRDTRANQPAAAVGNAGVLFCVTDEGNIVERSNGTTWDAYSPASVDETNVSITGGSITDLTTLEIPVSAAPTVASDGEIAGDTTVTDFTTGVIKFYLNEEQGIVAMPVAQFTTPSDGYVVAYDATADEFQLKAPAAGSGDVTSASNLTDNALVRGDGGAKGVQTSGVLVSDDDEISGYKGNINAQTGTTYTLQSSDTGKIVECTNGSAIAVTADPALPKGFACTIVQGGAGQVTIASSGSGTVVNRQSHTKTAGLNAMCALYVRSNSGSDAVFVLGGDTAA